MSKWEYYVFPLGNSGAGTICEKMNELGNEGWELVSVVSETKHRNIGQPPHSSLVYEPFTTAYFKREVQSAEGGEMVG